jgi:hypothetical protein
MPSDWLVGWLVGKGDNNRSDCNTDVRTEYRCETCVLQVFYRCVTGVLQMCYSCTAGVLQMCYSCTADT